MQLVLQYQPSIGTQNPNLLLLVVLIIIALGMVKEWLSDHKRSVADNHTN